MCSEKENTVFRTQKIVKLNITTQIKKAVTLSIGSGQNEFQRGFKDSNQQSFFYVHKICTYEKSFFVTDVGVLNIENFLIERKATSV